jgi:hypothetical protein
MVDCLHHTEGFAMKFSTGTVLFLAMTLASSQIGFAQGDGNGRVPNAVLVDADGTFVGVPISLDVYGEQGLVLMKSRDGQAVAVGLQGRAFSGGDEVLYLTSNCTGPAYVQPQIGIFARAAIAPPGRSVYIAQQNAMPQQITYFSLYEESQGCQPQSSGVVRTLVPAVTSGIRLNRFTLPLNTVIR